MSILIERNNIQLVNTYIIDAPQINSRRRVKLPFNPIVDGGIVKDIKFYPGTDVIAPIPYTAMYPTTMQENGVTYNLPNVFNYNSIMLTLAKKGGDYLFFDRPLSLFIPNYNSVPAPVIGGTRVGTNYRFKCEYDVDFDRSFIRFFTQIAVVFPLIIPLYFEMYPQSGERKR